MSIAPPSIIRREPDDTSVRNLEARWRASSFRNSSPAIKRLVPELKVISRAPAEYLQLAIASDAGWFADTNVVDALCPSRSTNRHQRFPADDRSKQPFRKFVGFIL